MEKQMRKEHLPKSAKRWLAIVLCMCLVGMMIPVTAMAASGDFSNGENNFHWALDDDGTLTITGTGAMPNWGDDTNKSPWNGNTQIKTVSIDNGVTYIGNYAFHDCNALTSITIPASVETIGGGAFWYCTALTSITIPESVETIGGGAFAGCRDLSEITIPAGVTSIGNLAFLYCSNLTTLTFAGGTLPTIGFDAFRECNISTIKVPIGKAENYTEFAESLGLTADDIEEFNPSGSGTPASPSSGTAHDGIGSIGADACYYDADTDSMSNDVKQITYGDAAYYPLFINRSEAPVTDHRMVEGLKIKAKYTEGEDLIEGEPQLVKVCVDGVYQYFIKFNVKQTLDAQLRDVCGTLTLNKSKKGKVDGMDYRVKDLTIDFDFEVGAEYNYADDTYPTVVDDPEMPIWPNEFFILKYDCDEEVEFEFGSDSNEGTFTVDVSGQGKNLITFNTELDENIASANPDAKIIAISFNNVRFNRTGVFNYEADDMNYAYEIKGGKLVKIAEFANGEVEFNTNTLGRYIFSDVELVSPETIGEAVFVRLT